MILTARAHLRRLRPSDYDNMRSLDSDPLIMRFTPSRVPQSEQQTRERLQTQIESQKNREPFGIWMAEVKNTDDFIGWFMLMPTGSDTVELGFMLVQSRWNQGWATEISRALLAYAKERGVRQVTAKTDIANHNSERVLVKLGFEFIENSLTEDKILGGLSELKNYRCLLHQ